MTTTTHQDLAAQICNAVAELPDRNSPEDWPEAMLVTHEELSGIVAAALEAASQPPGAEPECARWNFDATDTAIVVCKNLHDKGEKCEYEEMHPASVLQIINDLRSRVLEHTARAALSAPSPAQAPVVQGEINYLEEIYGFLCSTAPEGYADEAFRIVPNSLLADSVRDRIAGSRPSVGTDSGPVSGHAESSSSPDGRDGASVVSTTQAAEPLSHTDLNAAIVADWLADHDHLEEADKVRRIHGIGVKGANHG